MQQRGGWSGQSAPNVPYSMSVFLSDYLEELFPDKEPKLYPKDDPFKKYKQRLLVETVGSAVSTKLQKVVIGAESVS